MIGMVMFLVALFMLMLGFPVAFTFGGNVVHVFDPETGKNLEF